MQKMLVLASASPRRREILETAGYKFEIHTSNVEEITSGMPANELAMKNALSKASDVYKKLGNSYVVVGADTVVCHNGEILGKPKNEADAKQMLKNLSGGKHSVITGFAIIANGYEKCGCCETEVHFKTLSDEEISAYVKTGEPLDKAGAYGIQERAGLFVTHIVGDYFNVMGLPAASIYPHLTDLGILPEWQ